MGLSFFSSLLFPILSISASIFQLTLSTNFTEIYTLQAGDFLNISFESNERYLNGLFKISVHSTHPLQTPIYLGGNCETSLVIGPSTLFKYCRAGYYVQSQDLEFQKLGQGLVNSQVNQTLQLSVIFLPTQGLVESIPQDVLIDPFSRRRFEIWFKNNFTVLNIDFEPLQGGTSGLSAFVRDLENRYTMNCNSVPLSFIQCFIESSAPLELVFDNHAVEKLVRVVFYSEGIIEMNQIQMPAVNLKSQKFKFIRLWIINTGVIVLKAQRVLLETTGYLQLFYSSSVGSDCLGRSTFFPTDQNFCEMTYPAVETKLAFNAPEIGENYFIGIRSSVDQAVVLSTILTQTTELYLNTSTEVHIDISTYPYHYFKISLPNTTTSSFITFNVESPYNLSSNIYADSDCCSNHFSNFPNEDFNFDKGIDNLTIIVPRAETLFITVKVVMTGTYKISVTRTQGPHIPQILPRGPNIFWFFMCLSILGLVLQLYFCVEAIVTHRRNEEILNEEGASQNTTEADLPNTSTTGVPIIEVTPCEPERKYVDQEDEICVICWERKREVVLQPCQHFSACLKCATIIYKLSKKCPLCRSEIKSLRCHKITVS